MNSLAKWLWAIVIGIFLSYGIRLENPFLEDFRNIVGLILLIPAIKISFFSKKKPVKN